MKRLLLSVLTSLLVFPSSIAADEAAVEGTTKAWQRTTVSSPVEEIVAVMMIHLSPNGHLELRDKFRNLVYQAIVD